VTKPGDRYDITFRVPDPDSALFLASTGYYYEWMRTEWLKEENESALATLLLDPERALRDLAPAFKGMEAHMDRLFWESRIRLEPSRREAAP
jgi:hypothetical protein